jgi:hypothetical protein
MMRNLLSKKGEGITRMKLRCRWNLISIPSTIREIISYCKEDFQASWLSPDQVSKITNIDIRWSSFILPAAWSQPFESLKQLMADKIILPIYINDSSTLFPEVENLLLGPTTPASFNRMKKLRELSVTKFYNSPFRLTDLPDTLYKFRFYGEYNDVEFQGLPPTMVKVKKIVWSTIRSFPDGFFTRFPFLNSLSLSYCRVFDIEVFQPIYQTLIELSLRYDSALNAVSRVSGLSRFTRLKRVSIYCYCKNSRIHIEDLPLSLEKLCFNGNLRLPEPNASLKFNQLVYFKSEKMCVRSILGFFFLHSAPSLKSIEIEVSQYELPKIIMEMEESGQLNSSVEKLCWEFPNINEFDQFLILLLGRFPNLRKLTITQSCHYASQFSGVPELLLSVIQNGQCGLCLEQVKIISPKAIIHAEQTKVVAQLKQIGVSFDMKTSRY